MRYRGREVDVVGLWERWVTFPSAMKYKDDEFLPLVQCPNPSHDTFKQHFQINAREPLCHCFAHCGISGSWEHAICVIEGLYEKFKVDEAKDEREKRRRQDRAKREARKFILKFTSGKALRISQERRVQRASRPTKAVRRDDLAYESYLPPLAFEYLDSRGISSQSIFKWQLGWDGDSRRLVIPAFDLNYNLRFLIKRAVRDKDYPKYLYTEGFPKTSLLFGTCVLDRGLVRSSGLVVVEGSLDAIRLHQHGFSNTVAILGTGISDEQVEIIARLKPPKISFFFDRDTSGIRNIEIAARKLRKYPLYVVRFPKGVTDPAEFSQEQAERQIARAEPLFKFQRRLDHRLNTKKEKSVG